MEEYRNTIVEQCQGCEKVKNHLCSVYLYPECKWMNGKKCPMATNLVKEKVQEKNIDPIKASKRKIKGK